MGIFYFVAIKLIEFDCDGNPECLDGPWVFGLIFISGLAGCVVFALYWIVWGIKKIRQSSREIHFNKQIISQPNERLIQQ